MTRHGHLGLIYNVERLNELPAGTIVRAHRGVGLAGGPAAGDGTPANPWRTGPDQTVHCILVRQPDGWYGAFPNDGQPIQPDLVVPCTVLLLAPVGTPV